VHVATFEPAVMDDTKPYMKDDDAAESEPLQPIISKAVEDVTDAHESMYIHIVSL